LHNFESRYGCLAGGSSSRDENAIITYGLDEFVSAIKEAKNRLLILDPYFGARGDSGSYDHTGLPLVEKGLILSRVATVKIASETLSVRSNYRDGVQKLEDALSTGSKDPDLKWLDQLSKLNRFEAHDRFAIVDQELWHFGADVGGAHPGITMSSRGWSADETEAVRFFDQVWTQMKQRS
jgi:hypothetical protein